MHNEPELLERYREYIKQWRFKDVGSAINRIENVKVLQEFYKRDNDFQIIELWTYDSFNIKTLKTITIIDFEKHEVFIRDLEDGFKFLTNLLGVPINLLEQFYDQEEK